MFSFCLPIPSAGLGCGCGLCNPVLSPTKADESAGVVELEGRVRPVKEHESERLLAAALRLEGVELALELGDLSVLLVIDVRDDIDGPPMHLELVHYTAPDEQVVVDLAGDLGRWVGEPPLTVLGDGAGAEDRSGLGLGVGFADQLVAGRAARAADPVADGEDEEGDEEALHGVLLLPTDIIGRTWVVGESTILCSQKTDSAGRERRPTKFREKLREQSAFEVGPTRRRSGCDPGPRRGGGP